MQCGEFAAQTVCKNGRVCFHGEHCATDGSVITRVMLVRRAARARASSIPISNARLPHQQESRRYEARNPFDSATLHDVDASSARIECLEWQVRAAVTRAYVRNPATEL